MEHGPRWREGEVKKTTVEALQTFSQPFSVLLDPEVLPLPEKEAAVYQRLWIVIGGG
jgi:hypothetical protein